MTIIKDQVAIMVVVPITAHIALDSDTGKLTIRLAADSNNKNATVFPIGTLVEFLASEKMDGSIAHYLYTEVAEQAIDRVQVVNSPEQVADVNDIKPTQAGGSA